MNLDPGIVSSAVGTLMAAIPVAVSFIWAVKSDTRVLRERLDAVDRQLMKMDNVLVILAEGRGRMDLIDERLAMTGRRLDDLTRRYNDNADRD